MRGISVHTIAAALDVECGGVRLVSAALRGVRLTRLRVSAGAGNVSVRSTAATRLWASRRSLVPSADEQHALRAPATVVVHVYQCVARSFRARGEGNCDLADCPCIDLGAASVGL